MGRLKSINKGKQSKMRKNNKHQKKQMVKQLNLFEAIPAPIEIPQGGTGKESLSGGELFSKLKEQRILTEKV